MSAARPALPGWMPIAYGALDVHDSATFDAGAQILLIPARPGPALCLLEPAASLWRRLIDHGPVPTEALEPDEVVLVEHLDRLGLAAYGSSHPAALTTLSAPTLSAPLHELVYAMVARVAHEHGISCVFVKGPALYRQGLRAHEHSGDVDVWCPPAQAEALATALEPWGWRRAPDPWAGTPIPHSVTMLPTAWGCEIDVHRRIPGLTLDDDAAYDAVQRRTTTVTYAGVEVRVPVPATHAVLAALNAVRPGIGAGRRPTQASSAAASMLHVVGRPALDHARRIGAGSALREELRQLAPDEPVDDTATPRDWAWRSQPTRGRAYLVALGSLPRRDRIRVLMRLIWPPDDVALASARTAHDPTDDPSRARRRRLARGLRDALSRAPRRHRGKRS